MNTIISFTVNNLTDKAKENGCTVKDFAEYVAHALVYRLNNAIDEGRIALSGPSSATGVVVISGKDRITMETASYKNEAVPAQITKNLRGAFVGEHGWVITDRVSESAWKDAVGYSMDEIVSQGINTLENDRNS